MHRLEISDMATHGFVIGDRGEGASDCIPESLHLFAKKPKCTRCRDDISNSGQRERLSIKKAYWTLLGA